MTIDKQALREAAEKATKGNYVVGHNNINQRGHLISVFVCQEWRGEAGGVVAECHVNCLTETSEQVYANAEFIAVANPATMLALLDELDKKQQYIKLRDQENEDIALTVGKLRVELEAAKKRIAEQSAIVAAAEKLVRCKGRYHSELNYRALAKLFGVITPDLPPLEHENVHYADAAEVEITALRQRIAELEAKLETADKLQDGAFRDGLKAGFSYGQTDDQSGFTQCMSAYSTRTGIKVKGE
ncbi:ead/Ea22-like family protein [Salmonella enterica]|nr:ead/Ea22-like family protein [Salmonella enterica]EBT3693165.1 ead/Ea22-like family protein [Salmonella enterica]EMA7924833.1 ead/Ea22-like family protein [Salmonella enterica]